MKETRHFYYPPLPIERYRLHGAKDDEVSAIMGLERAKAVWNLFWLSVPALDSIPGAGRNWHRKYRPVPHAATSAVNDINEDEVLFHKVLMHPEKFIDWFEREDHEMYDCYTNLGGELWVEAVLLRANLVADRLVQENPVVVVRNNVIEVDFRRAA